MFVWMMQFTWIRLRSRDFHPDHLLLIFSYLFHRWIIKSEEQINATRRTKNCVHTIEISQMSIFVFHIKWRDRLPQGHKKKHRNFNILFVLGNNVVRSLSMHRNYNAWYWIRIWKKKDFFFLLSPIRKNWSWIRSKRSCHWNEIGVHLSYQNFVLRRLNCSGRTKNEANIRWNAISNNKKIT